MFDNKKLRQQFKSNVTNFSLFNSIPNKKFLILLFQNITIIYLLAIFNYCIVSLFDNLLSQMLSKVESIDIIEFYKQTLAIITIFITFIYITINL